jgi:large subunit ribosomal protein L23
MNLAKTAETQQWETVLTSNFLATKMHLDLIKYPVITEKSYIGLFKNRQYTFDVDLRLTKTQIKKLFESLFEVTIIGINTQIPPSRRIRVGAKNGYRPQYKRVIVTLQEGQSIRLTGV